MYQPNIHSFISKGLLTSAAFAAASLLFATMPASACTVSGGAKPQFASPVSATPASIALAHDNQSPVPDHTRKSNGFVGLWDSKLIYDGHVIDEGFDAFHSDGTEILVDQSNPITDNVCLGVWEQTGEATIKLKHPSWYFDTSGNLLGVVIIHETLKLDPDGDSYQGNASEDVYDTNGNKTGHYEFQIQANRITVS